MPIIDNDQWNLPGLSSDKVKALQNLYGKNSFELESSRNFLQIVIGNFKEPMFILLMVACFLYFLLGQSTEGFMMLTAIFLVSCISIFQDSRSENALKALQQYVTPKVKVMRDGTISEIEREELVPGDLMVLEEGVLIPADGEMIRLNDLTVNESILTGESMPVEKLLAADNNNVFQGTTVTTGNGLATVTAIGSKTALGKLGKMISGYQSPKTLLERQVQKFVRQLSTFGFAGFLAIFLVYYLKKGELAESLLLALTLAMSAIPEEIPVAFTSFMALGAYKLSMAGIISRRPQLVEHLGAVSVLCLDKTGTITENRMKVAAVYHHSSDKLIFPQSEDWNEADTVLHYANLASERQPFDPMEKAIAEANGQTGKNDIRNYTMVFEYPLEGKPPMMTHVYNCPAGKIAATKGAVARVLRVSGGLSENEKTKINSALETLATEGYRVIAVARAALNGRYPDTQDEFDWEFLGMIAFNDPPKQNMYEIIQQFHSAGIEVKMITGDYGRTAINIARRVGISNTSSWISGDDVMKMDQESLTKAVKENQVFARMFPEAKLKVIEALEKQGEVTAMTGDGVNDGPALKAASVGIAIGHSGTEVARQAADLVLTDDDMSKIVLAIKEGRRIFENFQKALRYIISIHIPIILTASVPVIAAWKYGQLFTPVHVIFLELMMGPTCSIFFEREPAEANIMLRTPRLKTAGLFAGKSATLAVLQGVVAGAGLLCLYYLLMMKGVKVTLVRSAVFFTLVVMNVLLTFSGRSFTKAIFKTYRYPNKLTPFIVLASVAFLGAVYLIPFLRDVFDVSLMSVKQLGLCLLTAVVFVLWIEVYKIINYPKS